MRDCTRQSITRRIVMPSLVDDFKCMHDDLLKLLNALDKNMSFICAGQNDAQAVCTIVEIGSDECKGWIH